MTYRISPNPPSWFRSFHRTVLLITELIQTPFFNMGLELIKVYTVKLFAVRTWICAYSNKNKIENRPTYSMPRYRE